MWTAIFIAFPFLVNAGAVWYVAVENRRRVARWRDAVTSHGLHVVESSRIPLGWARLKALKGPLQVRIEDSKHSAGPTRIVVAIAGPPGFSGVRIRRETSRTSVREIEIGDKTFDSAFSIEGPMRLVFVLLDAEVRRLLTAVNADCSRFGLANGEIRAETDDFQVPFILSDLLAVGWRFTQPLDVAERLAGNAQEDSEAGARLLNLILLVREFPAEPGTVEALRLACADPSPQVRLRAAKELGAEGRTVLQELAVSLVDDDCSAQAVSILDKELPFERLQGILLDALRQRRVLTAHACLEALGRGGAVEAVSMLTKVLVREKGELAAAAALALGATGSEAAEPPLIAALQRERVDIQVAAANALGRGGSTAAVLPLKEAAERSEGDPGVIRATRQAVAEIQSRVHGASPGELSLAGVEAGQLSLAEAEAGQLSIAADPAGDLSLPPEA